MSSIYKYGITPSSKRAEQDAFYERALIAAYDAANRAQVGMVENMNALDCGFAWVVVHDLKFMTFCRKRAKENGSRHYGSKHHAPGWCFWKPGSFNGQSIGIHEAGAQAFRDSLAHALQVHVEYGSRLD